jgi:NitT/TauT family transport system substrate-binding protein
MNDLLLLARRQLFSRREQYPKILFFLLFFFYALGWTFSQAQVTPNLNEKPLPVRSGPAPLRIAYSDWPGWLAFEIPLKKGWFKEAGLDVEFVWLEYVASLDAFTASKVDAVTMTNGDMLVLGSQGTRSKAIIATDFSNGNDMIVARPGIESLAGLKGKKIALEFGLVEHLLLLKGLEKNGLSPADIEIVKTPTDQTPQALISGKVDALGAWQPHAGKALIGLPGSKALWTSADTPGLIYDLLCVQPQSLSDRREEWKKVVQVWNRTVAFILDRKTMPEAIQIMSAKVNMSRLEYLPLMAGAFFLSPDESLRRFEPGDGLDSFVGSSRISDAFNTANGVYPKSQTVTDYFDASLLKEVLESSAPAELKYR